MKHYFIVGCLIVASMLLAGCAFMQRSIMAPVCPVENWLSHIEHDTRAWMRGADEWFIKGNPNLQAMPCGDYGAPLIDRKVKVPHFSRIKTDGDFQIRIVGSVSPEEVMMRGPRNAVQMIEVRVVDGILILHQMKKLSNMSYVVIRVDMNCLDQLIQTGRGKIEGLQIRGNLDILATGSGNIYLQGPMNVYRIRNVGRACVNIFDAITRELDIVTDGAGRTNVCGAVGIRSIMHHGRTSISIIGANSNCLRIYADGTGTIGINGPVNLCELRAFKTTHVYLNKVMSGSLTVDARQNSHVGLAGVANSANIHADDAAYVSATRLCADAAFVRTFRQSHVNINAREKVFVSAVDNSSIYFFGKPAILSQFSRDNGMIVAMQK